MPVLKRLFEPIKVGQVELKNRLIMLAMGTGLTDDEINQTIYNYYIERAKGGSSLLIIPASPSYKGGLGVMPGIHNDKMLPGLRWLANGIRKNGAKSCIQIFLLWRWAAGPDAPVRVVGPSDGLNQAVGVPMSPLSLDEVHQVVEEYGEAARRAREAGYDMIEVHAGMGFVINRFLSTVTNKRTDRYGGSLENRMRLLMEIIDSIQKKAGKDYPLSIRISADEFMPGGHTLVESRQVARALEAKGVHMLNVQAGWEECSTPIVYMTVPRAAFVYQAEEIKKVVKLPVCCAYRINDPFVAEEILTQGRADIIGLARALLADPYFPEKARRGQFDDIRKCIACNRCLDVGFGPLLVYERSLFECSVNPRLAREVETELVAAKKVKKVFVIGGGPGGLEAARVAALRGHKVTLFETKPQTGGMLLTAMMPPHKDEIGHLIDTMTYQAKKAGVKFRLNEPVNAKKIVAARPDAVVVATGAVPLVPAIPGVNGSNVVLATHVLHSRYPVGDKVVVIGGGLVGCETAEFLVEQGKKVTIVEMLPRIGADIGLTVRWGILTGLRKLGVKMEVKAKVTEINEKGVRVQREGDKVDFFEADSVVLAVGMKANKDLAEALQGKVPELYSVGDCVEAKRIPEATRAAYDVGMKL